MVKLFKRNEMPKCSIIVLNYNAKPYILKCLKSLEKINYPKGKYEIVLVDNAYTDGSKELVKKNFPKLKIITNWKNLGFSTGNNVALKSLKSDYYIILNPDTYVDKNWLINLVKVAKSDKSIGICTSKILTMDDKNKINYAGGIINFLGFAWPRGFNQRDMQNFDKVEETAFASGASMLIKKEVLDKVGYLDDDYFIYHEDADYSWRARLFGYKVVYVPSSIVYHKHEGTVGNEFKRIRKFYYLERNRLQTLIKNYSLKSLIVISPMLAFTEISITLYFMIVFKSAMKIATYMDIVKNFRKLMLKRAIIQHKRIVNDMKIIEHFTFSMPKYILKST